MSSHSAHNHGHADDWHHHDASEGQPQTEHGSRADPLTLAKWSAVLVVTLGVTILGIVMYFNHYSVLMRKERIEMGFGKEYQSMRAAADLELSEYRPIDKATGRVQIPIDVAMQKVIDRYAAQSQGASK